MGATNDTKGQKTLRLWGGESRVRVEGYARSVLNDAHTKMQEELAGEAARANSNYRERIQQRIDELERALGG